MRRLALALVLLTAGCGGTQATNTTPRQPHLPRTLAESWARQADAVAAALAENDGCTARARATALQESFIAAANGHRVPQRFLEPLGSSVNDLAGRITCTSQPAPVTTPTPAPAPQPTPKPAPAPTPTPAPAPKPKPGPKPSPGKHEKPPKHDHGKHRGKGGD